MGLPLRIGLMIDSYNQPKWVIRMIEELINSEYAHIALVLINETKASSCKTTLLRKICNKAIAYTYKKLIERHTYIDDALALENISDLTKEVQTHHIFPQYKQGANYLAKDDISFITENNIDICIRLGFGVLKGDVLKAPKFGIWSFHHGDNSEIKGMPAGFWESMEEWPVTGVTLQILSESLDSGTVINKSYSCTDKDSIADNKSNYYWKSSKLLTRKIKELHAHGHQAFLENLKAYNTPITFYSKQLYYKPKTIKYASLVLRKIFKKFTTLYNNYIYKNQWILLFSLSEKHQQDLHRYSKIIPPNDRFWADPHIICQSDKYYIFIEEVPYDSRRGHISLIEMDNSGNCKPTKKIIEEDFHMSYPFVFKHNGEFYMLPETAENKKISLYKCIEFPHKWELEMHLLENIQAYDATLLFDQGKWWIFANVVESDGISSWDELFIFYAEELLTTDWTAHAKNPVISDCRTSRPAGKFFTEGNKLYRPSQNSSHLYGYGLNINEVTQLSTTTYQEKIVSRATPDWDKTIIGIHTFNREANLTILDAKYKCKK